MGSETICLALSLVFVSVCLSKAFANCEFCSQIELPYESTGTIRASKSLNKVLGDKAVRSIILLKAKYAYNLSPFFLSSSVVSVNVPL